MDTPIVVLLNVANEGTLGNWLVPPVGVAAGVAPVPGVGRATGLCVPAVAGCRFKVTRPNASPPPIRMLRINRLRTAGIPNVRFFSGAFSTTGAAEKAAWGTGAGVKENCCGTIVGQGGAPAGR